jgi:RHH-type rel operon transcriptional repressor/antitoxin RelB
MLAVRLSEGTERRLEALAARTGRTKTFYAREAIEAHLDDLEDFYLAEERLRRFRDRDAVSAIDAIGVAPGDKARADLIETLRRLWAQGEASGAVVEGNFDAADIARRGHDRLAASRCDD